MAVQTITVLKSYFETGDVPTEAQFIDLFDTLFNLKIHYKGPYKNDAEAQAGSVELNEAYLLTANNDYGIPSNDEGSLKVRKV